jgi:hypothetical protein
MSRVVLAVFVDPVGSPPTRLSAASGGLGSGSVGRAG